MKPQTTSDALASKIQPQQTAALIDELRDIEAMEQGDRNSEWFRRLDAAWKSGDPEVYRAVEREFQAEKAMVYEKLGLRDLGQIIKDSLKNNLPLPVDSLEAIPLPNAEYPYDKRLWDNYIVDPHSTEGLQNMDRARKAIDDIPDLSNPSKKALSTLAGETIKTVGAAMDIYKIYDGLNQDFKDDGKIGSDSTRVVAKVMVGNAVGIAGAHIGKSVGSAAGSALLGATGGALTLGGATIPLATIGAVGGGGAGAFAGAIGGSVLGEALVDTVFECLDERRRMRQYVYE